MNILIVDDETSFRESLAETLQDLGAHVREASSMREALFILENGTFDALFLDFKMPQISGLEGMELVRKINPQIPIVMITAHLGSENAIQAMKLGAFDHLIKPIGRADIETVLVDLKKMITPRPSSLPLSPTASSALLGNSPQFRSVLKLIGKVAANDYAVLISGETGTGKELVARAIHDHSARAKNPFLAVNCAAIPEALMESELFGHMKGSFTGAISDKKGSFELAEGGTLFLDEIGDLPLNLQVKLLRVLQEKEIQPVGSSKPKRIDLRILTATHQNIGDMVQRKTFREDLFYRINVVEVKLPPLREREGDIELLAHHYLGDQRTLSSKALLKLQAYAWPGNIRELKSTIERGSMTARGQEIQAEDLNFLSTPLIVEGDLNHPAAVKELEKNLIRRALSESGGNRSEAARKLGIQRQLLYSKLKDYDLELS